MHYAIYTMKNLVRVHDNCHFDPDLISDPSPGKHTELQSSTLVNDTTASVDVSVQAVMNKTTSACGCLCLCVL